MAQTPKIFLAECINDLENYEHCILSECCVIVLFSFLRKKIYYFPKLYYIICICDGDALCCL